VYAGVCVCVYVCVCMYVCVCGFERSNDGDLEGMLNNAFFYYFKVTSWCFVGGSE